MLDIINGDELTFLRRSLLCLFKFSFDNFIKFGVSTIGVNNRLSIFCLVAVSVLQNTSLSALSLSSALRCKNSRDGLFFLAFGRTNETSNLLLPLFDSYLCVA
jgi:hypothetical protein